MDRIILFGGTFNPVHNGHIFIVKKCLKVIKSSKVFVIPSNTSPHKINKSDVISRFDRFNMCKLAFNGLDNVKVSDFEINKPGVSYTIDTVEYFVDCFQDRQIFLLLGSDIFLTFDLWKNYQKILENISLIVVPRNNNNLILVKNMIQKMRNYSNRIYVLDIKIPGISSTEIRYKIMRNENISNLVPYEVELYMKRKSLYQKGS